MVLTSFWVRSCNKLFVINENNNFTFSIITKKLTGGQFSTPTNFREANFSGGQFSRRPIFQEANFPGFIRECPTCPKNGRHFVLHCNFVRRFVHQHFVNQCFVLDSKHQVKTKLKLIFKCSCSFGKNKY